MSIVPVVVGVRFQKTGKIYHFDASAAPDLQAGDFVVVDTSRGQHIGEVIVLVADPAPSPDGAWKPIVRKATPRDLVMRQVWQNKEAEATTYCRAKLAESRVPGVKIVGAEFTFDGERLSILYSTETEEKMDLRKLRAAMQQIYPKSQVEMRQVGPRDVAKMLGGMGACGLESRCCTQFLTDFSPISIKMAKEQGISLTPTEITGMCGRLRCCLVYEYEHYLEARKTLPKRNKRVVTPQGEGKVIDAYPLKQSVMVLLDSGQRLEFHNDVLEPWDELDALRKKAQKPCQIHGDGPCNCARAAVAPADEKAPEIVAPAQPISPAQPAQPAKSKSSNRKPFRRFKKKKS